MCRCSYAYGVGRWALPLVVWLAVAAPAYPPAADDEQTDPRVRPAEGRRHSDFVLRFTVRTAPGHEGVYETSYLVEVRPPSGAAARCTPPAQPAITEGSPGERRRVPLDPPARGWCRGRHRVTVLLERGPYCPEGSEQPCPKFPTTVEDAGHTRFVVKKRRRS